MYKRPTSFSQSNMFHKCKRMWYYRYILKLPETQDYTYANAGKVLHQVIEELYKHNGQKDIEYFRTYFDERWKSFKLETSKLALKQDEYWLMFLNLKNKNVILTSNELKIFFEDVLGYIDGVCTNEHHIHDWKSSVRAEEKDVEYTMQVIFYAYLYFRKFGIIPTKLVVHYLRYPGTKGEIIIVPTEQQIKDIELWHTNIYNEMQIVAAEKKIPECGTCDPWCPFKSQCDTENLAGLYKYELRIVGNNVLVAGPIDELLDKGLKKKFSYELKDAFFIKKHNPYANTTVQFWNIQKRRLPLGFLSGLIKTLNDYAAYQKGDIEINIIDERKFNEHKVKMPDKFINGRELRDYQQKAVDTFIENKIGILEVGTGAGKTEIATEIIRKLGVKTLFIVDKIELLRQTKKRLQDSLGIEIGQLGYGEDDIKDVTVATIQTLNKRTQKYIHYLEGLRLVIFDECHKTSADSYMKLSSYIPNTEYRLGLSGTAFRDDGETMKINCVCGYNIFNLGTKVLIDNNWLVEPTILFYKGYMSDNEIDQYKREISHQLINETPDYAEYYIKFITNNTYRNNLLKNIIKNYEGKKILILTKLVDHGRFLESEIEGSKHLHGSTVKSEREEIFADFVSGKINVLVSTISIFSEGIDITNLDVIINMAANKGNVKTIQMLGRVLRTFQGKKNAYYIDFIDETHFFRLASHARKNALKAQGHTIRIVDANEKK